MNLANQREAAEQEEIHPKIQSNTRGESRQPARGRRGRRAGGDPPKDPVQHSRDSSDESDANVPPRERLPNVVVRLAVTTPNKQHPEQSLSHKVHFCKFCNVSTEQIIRHIETRHKTVPEVQRLANAPKKSEERAKLTKLLKNRGNFEHNIRVLTAKEGVIVTVRAPKYWTSASHYYPCTKCYGFYSSADLWRHDCVVKEQATIKECRALLATALNKESPVLNEILARMKADKVTELIRTDELIRRFMNIQLDKYENDELKIPLIRNRARDIGRLLKHIRDNNPNLSHLDMIDMIHPDRFDTVVDAVNELAKKGATDAASHAASLPIKLGQTLEKLVNIIKGLAIRRNDDDLFDKATRFAQLQKGEWADRVSLKSRKKLHHRKLNKASDVPKSDDVVKLAESLVDVAEERYKIFIDDPTQETGRKLSEALLAQVVLFNKRRGGEASRITVKNYKDCVQLWEETDNKGEIFCSLDEVEKDLAKNHMHINVVGKCNKHVPVILTLRMKQKFDALLEYRAHLGIPPDNKYFFGIPKCQTHIKAWDVMRNFNEQFGLPRITTTGLRKYLATTAQVMNLSDQEIGWLADHMGHTVAVHRKHYRKHSTAIELGKLTKLLHSCQAGTLHSQKGKNFDTMNAEFSHSQQILPDEESFAKNDGSNESSSEEEEEPQEEPVPVPSTSRGKGRRRKAEAKGEGGGKRTKVCYDVEASFKAVAEGEGGGKKRRKVIYDVEASEEEKAKISAAFEESIRKRKVPTKDQIYFNYIDPEGSRLHWKQIKGLISNQIAKARYHNERKGGH